MMDLYHCDRCKFFFGDFEEKFFGVFVDSEDEQKGNIALCEKCAKDMIKWVEDGVKEEGK